MNTAGETRRGVTQRRVAVFGASGHTAGFVTDELARRGFTPVLSGRDRGRLTAAARPGWALRTASIEDPSSLARALAGTQAVVNCAGPFGETAPALIDAALEAGVDYVDITAESLVTLETFERYGSRDDIEGPTVLPSAGFFGALGDLLATAAVGDWPAADQVEIAVALDRWWPTPGTREAMKRRAGRRVVLADGRIVVRRPDEPVPQREWTFPEPFGAQAVVGELSTVDVVTIARHLHVRDIHAYLNRAPIDDLMSLETPSPPAVDASGRSPQVFAVEVVVQRGRARRSIAASGRDIYAVTAPIVVEALERILTGRVRHTGVGSCGEIFDAADFLAALERDGHLTLMRR
jgi:hypothetical protein